MNDVELAKIEERWLAASGGPWSLVDKRENANLRAIIPVPGGKFLLVRSTQVFDAESAIKNGVCKSEADWVEMLEGYWKRGTRPSEGRRCVDTRNPRESRLARERAITKASNAGKVSLRTGEEYGEMLEHIPEPAMVFSEDASEADVQLVLHAPTDIGRLLAEVRRLRAEAEKDFGKSEDLRRQRDTLQVSERTLLGVVNKMREAALLVLDTTGDKKEATG